MMKRIELFSLINVSEENLNRFKCKNGDELWHAINSIGVLCYGKCPPLSDQERNELEQNPINLGYGWYKKQCENGKYKPTYYPIDLGPPTLAPTLAPTNMNIIISYIISLVDYLAALFKTTPGIIQIGIVVVLALIVIIIMFMIRSRKPPIDDQDGGFNLF